MTQFVGNTVSSGNVIYASDHNSLVTAIAAVLNGNIDNDNVKTGANIAGSKLADNSIDLTAKASSFDGWVEVTDSWTYASATTITVPTDATTKYSVGDFIKITQTTTKYFRIQVVAATLLTVQGIAGDTVANAAITDTYYSKTRTALGMPAAGLDWWQEIGRTTLTGTADSISVTGLPARRYLRIVVLLLNSGQLDATMRFNSDSGSNYSYQTSSDYGAEANSTSASSVALDTGTPSQNQLVVLDIFNIAAQEKLGILNQIMSGGTGAANAPDGRQGRIKWANTSDAISSVAVSNAGTGDFASGSEVIVLGHD